MKFLNRLFFILLLFLFFSGKANGTEVLADSAKSRQLVDNLNIRFMMRSEVKGDLNNQENIIGYSNKPAMVAAGFDMGNKLSFYSRYRFDFPTDIQKDGTPVSLLAFNVHYKPNDNMKFVVGKQIMLQGSWEFEYNPIDVFYYSLMGNHVQGFVSGIACHYNIKKHDMALQLSKVVDKDYLWSNSDSGWNGTLYYSSNYMNGFYKPIWSYTYTYAGYNRSLHNIMLGNQFNFDRCLFEMDIMAQNAYRYYGDGQKKTNEYSLVGKLEYLFPNDRISIAVKHAFDTRRLSFEDEKVTKENTSSLQLRYLASKTYGIDLHSTVAYRVNNTSQKYRNQFSSKDNMFFSFGATWDFSINPF